jgi:hypothetical protein
MSQPARIQENKIWTPAELRALPQIPRDAILAAAATAAEHIYRSDPELTAFEAFDEDDTNGESSGTETR